MLVLNLNENFAKVNPAFKKWSTILIILFSSISLQAQTGNPRGVEAVAIDLVKNIRAGSGEKIFVQTDKTVYAVTEKVWFKVFILDSVSDKLLATSGTLWIDIVDQNDQPVSQSFQHAAHSESGGAIALPDTIATGIYWLRVYTKFNVGKQTSNMAVRPLVLINSQVSARNEPPPEKMDQANTMIAGKWVVHIYPEGSHLMAGEDNLVGLKLEDINGHAFADSGMIKDRMNKILVRFVTNSSGLVKFRYNPTARGKYDIFIKNGSRYDSIGIMPMVNPFGAQISVTEQTPQSLKIKVLLEDSLANPKFTTYLIGINKDSVCFASVGQGMYEAFLPVNSFPAGISKLLLFNEQGLMLSERDVYLTRQKPEVFVKTAKDRYGPREKVDLDIQIRDPDGKPVLAAYTVSVTDSRMTDNGSLFFQDTTFKDSTQDLDLFLLTGRAKENIIGGMQADLSDDRPIIFDPFQFDGIMLNRKGKGLWNYQISMISLGKKFLVLQDTTEMNGSFNFSVPEFNDSLEVEFKVKPLIGIDQEYIIRANPKHFPALVTPNSKKIPWMSAWPYYQDKILKFQFDTLFARAHGMLPAVTVSTTYKKPPAKAGKTNILTQKEMLASGTQNVADIILTVQGIHLSNGHLTLGGVVAFNPSATDEPLVMMDGSIVNLSQSGEIEGSSPVLAFLKTLNVRQIESIRVLTGAESAEFGVRGGHGVIDITSTSAPYQPQDIQVNKKYRIEGYLMPSPFTDRDYSKVSDNSISDNRTTLYWNGSLVTDNQGTNKVSFYTGDLTTDYTITIAGVSASGARIYKTVILKM